MPLNNNPPLLPTQLLPQTSRAPVTQDISALRVHILALQRWFNGNFFVADGYPIPVTLANPMDAYAAFQALWSQENNPFAYLYDLKDENGTPLYQPYPAPLRYPIICMKLRSIAYRAEQSYGSRTFRRISYPTVSGDVKQRDLGNVTTARRPTAWNYSFQIDHFCDRPDTQAVFFQYWMRAFRGSQGAAETFIQVRYPGWVGDQTCRLVSSDITNVTDDAAGDNPTEYRTTVNITLEGYNPDLDLTLWPTFWIASNGLLITPDDIAKYFPYDTRPTENNPSFDTLPNLPPKN